MESGEFEAGGWEESGVWAREAQALRARMVAIATVRREIVENRHNTTIRVTFCEGKYDNKILIS